MNQQRKIELQVLALHRVLAERIRAGDSLPISKARDNLERWRQSFGGQLPPAYLFWQQRLEQPLADWIGLLETDSDEAARWRSSSPFAGAITAQERWRILRNAA